VRRQHYPLKPVSERYQYLSLMTLCLLGTLFLEFRFDARIWRRPKELVLALLVPFAVFNFVNEVAVWRKLWWYSDRFTTGIRLPRNYPIEEVVFFIAIPICALLTFEAATAVYDGRVKSAFGKQLSSHVQGEATDSGHTRSISVKVFLAGLFAAACAGLLLVELWLHRDSLEQFRGAGRDVLAATDSDLREYPIVAVGLLAGVAFLEWAWWRTGVFRKRAYWSTMAINMFFMVLVNGWLTKLSAPIVMYAEDEFSGLRPIWDIPIEDFGFGIALLTLVIMSWLRVTRVRAARARPVT
jgi:lycopene cyclase domain-containing protein